MDLEFHDVLIVLNLKDFLRTVKSLFLNNDDNNNRNSNNNNNNNFKHTIFYNKIKILTKLN